MDNHHRKVLSNIPCSIKNSLNIQKACSAMKVKNIFTNLMIDDLMKNDANFFFEELCTRGPKAYIHAIEAFERSDHFAIAKYLIDNVKPQSFTQNVNDVD